MLDFAVKLTENAAAVDESDFERLREAGYSRRAIWDVGSVTALFNLSNRMVHLADMRPNEEFYDVSQPPPRPVSIFDSINGHDFDATSRPRRCVGRDRRRYSS